MGIASTYFDQLSNQVQPTILKDPMPELVEGNH